MSIPFTEFPAIKKFSDVVKTVNYCYCYRGEEPTITFTGTVKIHGTNAGIGWDFKESSLSCQSRKRIITPKKDNSGFAAFVYENQEGIKRLMLNARETLELHENAKLILYGEWCGPKIQKNVAVNELKTRIFVIFAGVWWVDYEEQTWLTPEQIAKILPPEDIAECVFQIFQFPNWTRKITFSEASLSLIQNELNDMTLSVDKECPVGKHFGISGVGEGIVWISQIEHNGVTHHLRFKVKGPNHVITKSKMLASANLEKLENINSLLEYALTENRMEQGYSELFTQPGTPPSHSDIGRFIKWVCDDVLKEETDTMIANGIKPKDVQKSIKQRARLWIIKRLENL